ncbi:MAG: shikimate kinase [Promethearchaeota archaeon]
MKNKVKTNISLIGFMGTGKTTVGRIVAERLNKRFIECDDFIVKKAGKSIPEIFALDGEIAFRELEIQVMKEIQDENNCVFSTGGGVVLNNINVLYMNKSSVVICLVARPDVIYKRIMNEGKEKRPLLAKPDPMAEIVRLLEFRKPFYAAATNLLIDTSNLPIEDVVDKVIELYQNNCQE